MSMLRRSLREGLLLVVALCALSAGRSLPAGHEPALIPMRPLRASYRSEEHTSELQSH